MDQAAFLSCPQCHHHNSLEAQSCELCEWSFHSNEDDVKKTQAPAKTDPNMTVDSNAVTLENVDPQVTMAPAVLAANQQRATDKKTFNLAGDLSHFEVIKVLGQGGMGMVYHAKDRTLKRDVALKMLRPMAGGTQLSTEALLDEARMASQLNHPNIVTIYDVARADNSNYIVMEWVDGQSLDEMIPEDGLPLTTAINYAKQIADGLSAAHQKYIIHRDIKPQNIMLSEQNTLKILDFGIAGLVKHIAEQGDDSTKNQNQTTPAAGTPSYMSPEQAQGMNLDPRSDIYSLGIVLYQMLTGKRPFVGNTSADVKQKICTGQFKPIEELKPELPTGVVQVINKMLATAKDQRWQSSSDLAAALDGLYSELTYSKNWWQKRHWLTQAALLLPFVIALGWTAKDILFPASTQQLIEQQLTEATKVAILPFDNISGDPTLQLFGDGLAVNLSTDLATVANEIGDTWIVPATEISRMKEVTPKSVADKYGVELILTGSMQHMGSTRLMVLNLIDAQSGQQLKTTELNIEADSLYAGHALIRSEAMTLLGWPLTASMTDKFKQERPQLDGAYKHYVEGRGYLYRYDQEGNIDKAINSFKAAIGIDNNYEDAYVGLSEILLRKYIRTKDSNWLSEVSAVIQNIENINSNNSYINFLTAEVAMKKGEYQTAVDEYTISKNKNPNDINSIRGLAKALSKLGKHSEAEAIYTQLQKEKPNNWRIISDFGIFYFGIGNYEGAKNQFEKLSKLSPNNNIGVRNMAAAYYALGDIDNAILYTNKSIAIKPSDQAYSNLGTMLFYENRYDESVKAYEKAVQLKASNYLHWGNLGDAYKMVDNPKALNSFQKAEEKAQVALNVNPNDSSIKADVAYYLANLDKVDAAKNFAKQIGVMNSGSENFVVATAYNELNDVEKTLQHIEIALQKNYPADEIRSSPLINQAKADPRFEKILTEKEK